MKRLHHLPVSDFEPTQRTRGLYKSSGITCYERSACTTTRALDSSCLVGVHNTSTQHGRTAPHLGIGTDHCRISVFRVSYGTAVSPRLASSSRLVYSKTRRLPHAPASISNHFLFFLICTFLMLHKLQK